VFNTTSYNFTASLYLWYAWYYTLQQVALNIVDVMLKMAQIVPRVETVLYTGWSACETADNIRPIILPHLIDACTSTVIYLHNIGLISLMSIMELIDING